MTRLAPGDPAPLFVGRTTDGDDWWLSTAAGDHIVLTFADHTITVGWPAPVRTILDDQGSVAEHYGLTGEHRTVVLDRRLRVLAVLDDEARVLRAPGRRVRPVHPPRPARRRGRLLLRTAPRGDPSHRGRRHCTVPFLYDEAGEERRRRNLPLSLSDHECRDLGA